MATTEPENRQRNSASPSPPPVPPTASTPGIRASAFQKLHNDALASTLKAISYDSFADCFPLIAAQAPSSLRAMHGDFISRLERFAKEEFTQILTERSVVPNLNTLDSLISDAKIRKSQAQPPHSHPSNSSNPSNSDNIGNATAPPPHTLPPPIILQAHLKPIQTSQQSQLNARLQTVESQNAEMAVRMAEQRREIEGLMGVLEGVVRDLEGAGKELAEVEREEGLSGEGREAEEILRG